MTFTTRRRFLRDVLSVGAGAVAAGQLGPLARLARAQQMQPDAPDRYYVICWFAGGWDPLLSLDPRDPRDFPSTPESIDATQIQPAYELVEMRDADVQRVAVGDERVTVGPYLGQLARRLDHVCIVRGIDMETVAHPAGYRRFLTGHPPSGVLARGSNASTWLTARLGGDVLIPQLSIGVESYNVDQPAFATAIFANDNNDLRRLLQPAGEAFDPAVAAAIDAHIAEAADCPEPAASRPWQAAEYARRQSRVLVESGLWRRFDFGARDDPTIDDLRDRFGGLATGPMRNAAVAFSALTGGVSRVVCAQMAGGTLDTHGPDWPLLQGPRQMQGFDALAALIDALRATEYRAGQSWFDHTTIVAFSEFGRTPFINAVGGRDHHLVTSALLAGGGVRGGQVIGATSDIGYLARPVDLTTGALAPDGDVLGPEHIWRTLFDEVGIPRGAAAGPDLRCEAIGPLLRG